MDSYSDNLRKIRSLLIVTSLQQKTDLASYELLRKLEIELVWEPIDELGIDEDAWNYIKDQGYDPKFVFCHPNVVKLVPLTSAYYRGLTALSLKAVKEYFGSVDNLEKGTNRTKLTDKKALELCILYNRFVSTIIKGSTAWTLDDGMRTIIATLGITYDGVMRNKVGTIAEEHIRTLVYNWLKDRSLIKETDVREILSAADLPKICTLIDGTIMKFSSEPDISFTKDEELLAVVEIKGGIDPAGALERYGAATKSFQHSLTASSRCTNYFLSAVFTTELTKRIKADRLVDHYYDIIEILEDPDLRESFFQELFHYTLRLI